MGTVPPDGFLPKCQHMFHEDLFSWMSTRRRTLMTLICLQNAYQKHEEVVAAQGVKIIAKDLDHALAGLPMHVAKKPDEVEVYKVRFVCTCRLVVSLISDGVKLVQHLLKVAVASCVFFQDEIAGAIKEILAGIKVQERGVFVQASTIGSLEALLEFLRTSKISVSEYQVENESISQPLKHAELKICFDHDRKITRVSLWPFLFSTLV